MTGQVTGTFAMHGTRHSPAAAAAPRNEAGNRRRWCGAAQSLHQSLQIVGQFFRKTQRTTYHLMTEITQQRSRYGIRRLGRMEYQTRSQRMPDSGKDCSGFSSLSMTTRSIGSTTC
jgi:hypothetical protein